MLLEPASEQLLRSKMLLKPGPELAERSKVLLEPASEQLIRSKMLLKPAPDVAGRSKVLLEPASGQLVRSKLLLKPAPEPAERSKMLLGRSKMLVEIAFRNNVSEYVFEVTSLFMDGLSYT